MIESRPKTDYGNDEISHRGLIQKAVVCGDHFARNASLIDRWDAFPDVEFLDLLRSGLLTAPLPVPLGGESLGLNLGPVTRPGTTEVLLRVLEEVGRGSIAVGRLYEGHVNALFLLHRFGRADQLEGWAADARDGKIFGVWNTQGQDGVRFSDLDRSGLTRIHGAKTFASGAGHITRPIVTGKRGDGGWQMAVVPTDQLAVQVDTSGWRPLGVRASASHRVDFAGVEIDPATAWLGTGGAYFREPWFSGGAIRFAAVQLGGARALLDATVATLQEHGRTNDPYQRTRVGSMAIAVESGRQWLRSAAEVADRVVDDEDQTVVASAITHAQMTRTAISSICQSVLQLAEESVGARGLIEPHPIERIGRDLTMYLRQPGPDAALAQIGESWFAGRPITATTDRQERR